MEHSRYFIKLAYNGTRYHGWQIQKNANSVQHLLTDSLSMMLRKQVKLTGCGRTDAGVHAREYFAHFDIDNKLTVHGITKLIFKLNSFLPDDLAIYSILPVLPDANARFAAISRTYTYHINRTKNPFLQDVSYYLFGKIDLGVMNEGARIIQNARDFTSFSKVDSDTKTNICRVNNALWEEHGDHLVFTISADRFLRNMVRAIVGTLLELGKGKLQLDDITRIIVEKNRSSAGESVPACGLFLEKIEYPQSIFLEL